MQVSLNGDSTIVELAQDQVALSEILNGEDTHAKNQAAFSLPSRLIAKIFLFRTIFRGSGWSFANDPDFTHVSSSPEFWDDMNAKFYAKYSDIDKVHNRWKDVVISGKPIQGPLGRAWSINLQRDRFGNIKIPWTTLSNYPVQGTGADLMMLARLAAHKRIRDAGLLCDSIVVDTQEKYLEPIAKIFEEVFTDLPAIVKKTFGYEWKTPMAGECKYGPNMLQMEKFK